MNVWEINDRDGGSLSLEKRKMSALDREDPAASKVSPLLDRYFLYGFC
jgi:hypothetical protein